MKRFGFLVIFILSLSMLNAIEQAEIKDILIGSSWLDDYGFIKLTFKSDGTCHYLEDNMGGSIDWKGPFTIKDEKIIFTANGNTYSYQLVESKDSFSNRYYLTPGRHPADFLWGISYILPEMTEKSWNGYEAYTLKSRKMKVLENLKMRENPDIKSKRVIISQFMDEGNINILSKGEEVYVIGRSKEKQKIGKWNNYWYLVSLPHSMYTKVTYYDPDEDGYNMDAPTLPNLAWCYGEFLK